MSVVRVKMGICEYYFEYETLDDVKNHFKKEAMPYIGLDTFDTYGGGSKGKRVLVNELTLDDLAWVNEKCEYGDRYLRGWKSQ